MNADEASAAGPTPFFRFRATQLGKYFYGYCSQVYVDEQRVTFSGRKLPRYIFEPEDTEPRIEFRNLGPLSLLRKDFHIIVIACAPPRWLRTDP